MNPLKTSTLLFLTLSISTASAAIFDDASEITGIYDLSSFENQSDLSTVQEESPYTNLNEQRKHLKTKYIAVEKLISEGKYIEARIQLDNYLTKSSNDPNLYNLLGRLDSLENKITSAQHNFNKSIMLNQNNLLAYQGLARISLNEQQLTEAKTSIDKMLSIDNNYFFTYIVQAEYFYQKNDLLQTEQSLLTAYQKVKGNVAVQVKVLSILGKFYTSQDKHFKTLQLAKELYTNNDNNVLALSFYATNLIANKEFNRAETLLIKIIQLNKTDISHRVLLAKLLTEQPDKTTEAIQLFDEAYSINKNNLNILVLKASFLTQLKEYSQALNTADQLINAAPSSAIGYQLKGDIYKAAGNNSMAIKMYESAIQKNPATSAVFSLADLFAKEKQFSKAINLLRLQLGKNNNDSVVFFKLAIVYEKKGDFAQAESYYKKVLRISSTHVPSLNNLALLFIQQNNSEALKLSEKAFKQAGHSAAIADTYGYALVLFGEPKVGLQILEDAVKQSPKVLAIQLHLAIAHSKLDHNDLAVQLLEKITLENQDYPEKENAIALLRQLKKQ